MKKNMAQSNCGVACQRNTNKVGRNMLACFTEFQICMIRCLELFMGLSKSIVTARSFITFTHNRSLDHVILIARFSLFKNDLLLMNNNLILFPQASFKRQVKKVITEPCGSVSLKYPCSVS